MSIITVSVFVLLLAAGCFGSWKGALYWQNRTRDARKEDPRDQEIRELTAALSIARKDADKLGKSSSTQDHEIAELRIKFQKLTEVLSETRQKLDAAQDNLAKEIEQKSELDAKLSAMHNELSETKSRNSELELRVKIDSPTSGLVAGLDDTMEDDEKEVFTIRHEHKILKERVGELQTSLDEQSAESQRWKQHCTVMTKTNKALRSNVENLNKKLEGFDDIKAAAEQLPGALQKNSEMQTELTELRDVRDDNMALNARVDELAAGLQAKSEELNEAQIHVTELQNKVDELAGVHDENARLAAELGQTSQQLADSQHEATELKTEVNELRGVQDENTNLKSRIDELQQIETDNAALRSQLRQESREHASAMEVAEEEKAQLIVRLDALDRIQAENEQLLEQAKDSRQSYSAELQRRQQQIQELETQCSALEESVVKLGHVEADNSTLRDRLLELERSCQDQKAANSELQERVAILSDEVREIPELRSRAEELSRELGIAAAVSSELEQVRRAHETACAEAEELKLQLAETSHLQTAIEQSQAKFDDLQVAYEEIDTCRKELTEKLVNAQSEKEALAADLGALDLAKTQMEHELQVLRDTNAGLLARLESAKTDANTEARTSIQTTSDDTDRLPVLDIGVAQQAEEDSQDDLKAIRGVGAKIEQKLNMLGIVNFKDLAELGPEDYERAAELIPNLESRMKRDNWTEQARELHRAKHSDTV